MSRQNEIRMAGDSSREEATCVIRGTDLDGLAFTGATVGNLHMCPPVGRADIYSPTERREIDSVTGSTLVVYAWSGYARWPW